MFGSEVEFRMNGYVQMVTLIGKEWRNSCGCTWSIVVGKFGKREKFRPVILLIIAEDSQVLFQCLIESFSLTVAFWVISRGKMDFHV